VNRILLLSAYRSDSHAVWADWLQGNIPGVEWQVLELPGRHFAWRIRGNPLSWIDEIPEDPPDLVLATSMVDLATVRGLHPHLAKVPAWYYFHENQFAYPVSDRQVTSIEACMVQVYGALAAERVLFNSAFNRDSFLDGLSELLKRLPDGVPAGVRERLETRCEVLPVPIAPVPAAGQRDHKLVVWNHRWEYDKAPERFAAAMLDLAASGIEFRLALLGRRPHTPPPALRQLRQDLADRIVADGYLPGPEYRRLLGRAGLVVSTAIHEFQGISMLEAASAGVRPLVPDALCYPEQYPPEYRYPAGNHQALVERLGSWLTSALPPRCKVDDWLTPVTGRRWQALLGDC
jgi:glycosyltransferase involved in cell wall biosynthesis